MKLRFLLLSMFFAGILSAQVECDYPEDVITSLVITEVRNTGTRDAYLEFTNMGSKPVQLSEFKFGQLRSQLSTGQIFDLCIDPWFNDTYEYLFLPDRILDPGKSFVITTAYDYLPRHYKEGLGRLGGMERPKQPEMYEIADKLLHQEEPIDGVVYAGDSVTTSLNDPDNRLNRESNYFYIHSRTRGALYYLEHHYAEGDSAVVDQVGGVFDDNGRNNPRPYDVAGVEEATANSLLIRKASVTRGSLDFDSERGISLEDSRWLPIQYPDGYDAWRDLWWTVGNHGSYIFDENTLEPLTDAISVDYAGKKITVPWGIRRLDDIMRHMKKKPGIAWRYDLNPIREDSLYRSARTGDQLTIYVAGNTLHTATFDIEVKESVADDNIVIPIDHRNSEGMITTRTQNGILSWPRVTKHASGVDTITGSAFGLAFDMHSDSLLKYLEKPPKVSWEFVWVDGQVRADLKNGDKLKVTSENGITKEYFIRVQTYNPSRNADLAAITWPDIPDFYRGFFGWTGDTIPGFGVGTTSYRIEVPFDVEGIPALKAITSHINASVSVTRARSLTGSIQDRTVTFEVTAEDDTIKKLYRVELVKEKLPHQIEPFMADPIISEYVNHWYGFNNFVELYNPGNQPIDLRNYMLGHGRVNNPYAPVQGVPRWDRRYTTYIPGLKYVDEVEWGFKPKILLPDPNVNPIIPGGGTFVLAIIGRDLGVYIPPYDVNFTSEPSRVSGHPNPWREHMTWTSGSGTPIPPIGNRGGTMMLYKILNDSIKNGLKPASDVNDFEIIDAWGMKDQASWVVGDYVMGKNEMGNVFIRKPHVWQGNPGFGPEGSFGTSDDDCEWTIIQPGIDFGHISMPQRIGAVYSSLNRHTMITPTFYRSTVNSSVYKVSQGYGPDEKIEGLKTGITVAEFLANINKEDEDQSLKITSSADGSELGSEATIQLNDVLEVVSADGINTTLYRLDVTEAGLSSDAYLTSNRWTIDVTVEPKSAGDASVEDDGIGSVSNFDYGTTIKTIVDNITVPDGATLTVIDGNGAYVPFTTLNFDTVYVSVTVNPNIYLDVVAEDNETRIVYQLQPSTSASDAFILSDVYEVSQMDNLIHFVPRGTNFDAFLSNIIPSLGASLKLVDKMGFERTQGNIREDDKVVVTSSNGLNTRVYFISFLPTATILQTTYLAYVLSEAYIVDQVDYMISAGLASLTSETLLSEFLAYIMPSMGATVAIVDMDGNVKSTGDLNDGDVLQVTSADGKIVTTYTLELDLTPTETVGMQRNIEIFPNPASDKLNIQGIDAGNRIRIFSAAGALIHEVKAQSSLELISLENIPAGMFMIVISDNDQLLGRYKAIRK